jgi:hypothetical protein
MSSMRSRTCVSGGGGAGDTRARGRAGDVDRAGDRRRGGEVALARVERLLDFCFSALAAAPSARRSSGGAGRDAL